MTHQDARDILNTMLFLGWVIFCGSVGQIVVLTQIRKLLTK